MSAEQNLVDEPLGRALRRATGLRLIEYNSQHYAVRRGIHTVGHLTFNEESELMTTTPEALLSKIRDWQEKVLMRELDLIFDGQDYWDVG